MRLPPALLHRMAVSTLASTLVLVAPEARAATTPPAGKVDARIRVVTYNPDLILPKPLDPALLPIGLDESIEPNIFPK